MKKITFYTDMVMILVTVIWGYGFIATKVAVEQISTYELIFYRFLISSLLLTAVFFKDFKTADKKDVKNCVVLGALLCAGFLTQTEALHYTTVAKNAFLTTLNVVLVPIIVAVIHKKKVEKSSIAGCALAVTGTGVLTLNMDFSVNFGDFLSIMCAAFFSFHIYYLGEFVKETKWSVLAAGQLVAVTIVAFFCALFTGNIGPINANAGAISGVVYLAVFSTCFCFMAQTFCQKFTSQIKAVIIFSLEAVFASLFAVIIFKDPVTPRFLVGGALIFTAVIVSSLRSNHNKERVVCIENSD